MTMANHGVRPAAARVQPQAAPPERPPEAAPVPVGPPVQAPPPAKPGRLTPDERRALRQQINDAGRQIYRPERP
jgi:hypothetical protein